MRLIDADTAIEKFNEAEDYKGYLKRDPEIILNSIPTVDAVPVVHAHWIYVELGTPTRWSYRCSKCSRLSGFPSEYCPYCGAIMDEGVSE